MAFIGRNPLLFSWVLFLILIEQRANAQWTSPQPFGSTCFIENKGQYPIPAPRTGQVHFVMEGNTKAVFTQKGILYRFVRSRDSDNMGPFFNKEKENETIDEKISRKAKTLPDSLIYSYVEVEWIGCNPNAQIIGLDEESHYYTYALDNRTDEGLKGIRASGFKIILVKDLYPGIDLRYSCTDTHQGFKYEFQLQPGADPKKIKMRYHGDVQKLEIDSAGILRMQSTYGQVSDSGLVAKTTRGREFACVFSNTAFDVTLDFPRGYPHRESWIIDPWVTLNLNSLGLNNVAYDVDYDYQGNAYVFGGGDPFSVSSSTPFKISKYNSSGLLLWTFLGNLPAIGWSNIGIGLPPDTFAGNFLVEKSSGKVYVSEGVNAFGATTIRLDSSGNYDNFISTVNPSYLETWDMAFDCNSGVIYCLGGGWTTNINFGVLDPTSGVVVNTNITGQPGGGQDIVSGALDNNGDIYVVFASNVLYKINSTRNGFDWAAPTGYSTLIEARNKRKIKNYFSNGANVLAVNDFYVFYYDGVNLKAFNKSNGSVIGTPLTFTGNTPTYQYGIAVDNCNNVYIGDNGQINTYFFNGTTFLGTGSISTTSTGGTGAVFDIRYNPVSNLLYATGENFLGVYIAQQSSACPPLILSSTVLLSIQSNCSGTAIANANTSQPGLNFQYTWYDSAGVIIRNQYTLSNSDTINNLTPGRYTILLSINPLCGGPSITDTVLVSSILLDTLTVSAKCPGSLDGSASIANIVGGQPPYSHSWSTIPIQTTASASGLASGWYSCVTTDASGCSRTDSLFVGEPSAIQVTVNKTNPSCNGASDGAVQLLVAGGTQPYSYSWSVNGNNSATISNLTAGTINYTVIDANNCLFSDTVVLTNPPYFPIALSAQPDSICAGRSLTLIASGGIQYQWSNGASGSSLNVTPALSGYYSVVASNSAGCTSVDSIFVTVLNNPVMNLINDTLCFGQQYQPTYTLTGGPANGITWDLGDGNQATGTALAHTYNQPGVYAVQAQVTNYLGCIAEANANVKVWPLPQAVLDLNLTNGCQPLTVTLTDQSLTAGDPIIQVRWLPWGILGSSTYNHTFAQSGTYDVGIEVKTQAGCKDDTLLAGVVTVYPQAKAGFIVLNQPISELYPRVQIQDQSINAESWQWTFSDGFTSTLNEPEHMLADTGNYTIVQIVTTSEGCNDTLMKEITVIPEQMIWIPNAFSPNGDDKNEYFSATGWNITEYKMIIMNRWGQLLYETRDLNKGWDGVYNDSNSPEGVYSYYITFRDLKGREQIKVGKFTLIR